MNKTWSKPYEVHLMDRSSFTEKVEFEDGECIYKELFTPEVERYSFATEEEAYEHAKQYGLKDDEYDVIKWMY